MKTFHSVPPQSTSVQRTVCVWYYLQARYKPRREVRASDLLPRQSPTAKNFLFGAHEGRHLLPPSRRGHSTPSPSTALTQRGAPGLRGAPGTLQLEGVTVPSARSTSTLVPAAKQLYGHLHYYMINNPVFPSDNIHNSSAPGIHPSRYQVLLHTCCWEQPDQQHHRIHLVTQTNKL